MRLSLLEAAATEVCCTTSGCEAGVIGSGGRGGSPEVDFPEFEGLKLGPLCRINLQHNTNQIYDSPGIVVAGRLAAPLVETGVHLHRNWGE